MSRRPSPLWSLALALLIAGAARGQSVLPEDPPRPYAPKAPPTQEDRDRRESLHHYVSGLMCLKEDRLLEALKEFQEAARLDPRPAAVYRVQVPLLLGLERAGEALEACRKALDRDADDADAWVIAARLHRAMGQSARARDALERGLKAPGLADRPELAQQMYADLGGLYEADEQYGAAADAYRNAAELLDHPDVIAEHVHVGKEQVLQRAAETYERIGDLYRRAKKYEPAVAAYTEAQKRAPQRAERLHFNLAQVYREQGNDAKALAHLDAYLRTQPLGMDGYEMKIAVLRAARRDDAIVPWLEQAAKLDAHNVGLHLLLARECGRAKQLARAVQIYQALAETSPSVELYRGLFRLYLGETADGPARALAVVEQVIGRSAGKKVPDSVGAAQAKAMVAALRDDAAASGGIVAAAIRALGQGQPLRFETQQLLALLADKHRRLDEAEHLFRACLRQLPPQAETVTYEGLLRVLGKAHKYQAQLEVCDGALNGAPERGLPKAQATSQLLFQTEKARALAGLRRFDEAVQAADRALLLAGDNNRLLVRHLRVRLLTMAGRYADGEKECVAMLKDYTQPGEVMETRYLLSGVYAAAKQPARAEEQLLLILKADPDSAVANNDLGYQWADQGKNLPEAERMIRRAIELDRRQRLGAGAPPVPGEPAPPPPITPVSATSADVEDNAAYVDSLGWVLFRRGQVEQARKELERAAGLPDGDDPVIWDHLGDVYRHLQRAGDARAAWEQALRLYEQGTRRIDDERCQELRRKIKAAPR